MKSITVTKKAWEELKAIHAGIYCLNHRYLTDYDREKIDSCIKCNFTELDREKVPFSFQNTIIALAEKKEDILSIKNYYNLIIS